MYGIGLLKGLKVSLGWFLRKNLTENYPDVKPNLPEASHGKPVFDYDKCTACNLCVVSCPNKVITLETEQVGKKKVVTKYDFNLHYCMFCGFCQEACNFDAIKFNQDFELTKFNHEDINLHFATPELIAKKKEQVLKAEAEKAAAEAAAGEKAPAEKAPVKKAPVEKAKAAAPEKEES